MSYYSSHYGPCFTEHIQSDKIEPEDVHNEELIELDIYKFAHEERLY